MKILVTLLTVLFSVNLMAQYGGVTFMPPVDWDAMNSAAAAKEKVAVAAAKSTYSDIFGAYTTGHWRGGDTVVVKSNDGCSVRLVVKGQKVRLSRLNNGPVCN